MKVRRDNGQLMLTGDIEDIRLNENGNAVLEIRTYARSTRYRVVITPNDMDRMKLLFNKTATLL